MTRVWKMWTLGLVVLLAGCLGQAALADDPKPTNGVGYVLLPKEIPAHMDGVYRLNAYDEPYGPVALGVRMFDLQFSVATTVNGLAVDQDNKVYLFVCPSVSGDYVEVAKQGWIPPGAFDPESPAFIKLIGQPFSADQVSRDITGPMPNRQYDHGTTNYDGDFWDYGPYAASPHYPSGWPHTHAAYTKGSFTDESGNPYQYQFNPGQPASHRGLPLWNGPGAGAAGIKHPEDPYKVILPNKWGGISWFAFATSRAPTPFQLMDGNGGRDKMTQNDFRLKHDNVSDGFRRKVYTSEGYPYDMFIPLMSPYWDAHYISAVVKRTYKKRDRSLDLYSYKDTVVPPPAPPYTRVPQKDHPKVLSATDLDITESYGKTCGDGCIPGGEMNPQAVGKIESVVQVFTSTTGRRYGFNPFGKDVGPYGESDAALRVVYNGVTYNLDLTPTNLRNTAYLAGLGYEPKKVTRMGTSSNFNPVPVPVTRAPDYLYGSVAEKFVMQDSWWGIGGIGFEYFSNDVTTPNGKTFTKGHIYRLDYLDSSTPNAEDVGHFPGAVDSIGVDGEGHLYVLTTELDCPNDPAWPDPAGVPQGPDLDPKWPSGTITGHPDYLDKGKWMRPGYGVPDYEIPGPGQPGDYLDLFFRQKVYKVARKYTASAGGGYSASTVEERGRVEAGYDTICRKLRYDGGTSYSWLTGWYHKDNIPGRVASVKAEFAVVNIAARPQVFRPDTEAYSICRDDAGDGGKRVSSTVPIYEGTKVTFKVEGYKPFGADGVRQHFRGIGYIPDLGETSVNMIPPYINYDEDGDGNAGGFPSSLFESPSRKTLVTWHVDLVDTTDSSGEILLKSFTSGATESDEYKTFSFTFPHPGNYRVWAEITYNYFNYADLEKNSNKQNPRPSDLACVAQSKTVTTTKVLYQVQTNPFSGDKGYISNINLLNAAHLQGVDPVGGGGTTYDLPENASPTALSVQFDAQFAQDANRYEAGDYLNYGGVGVWDYGDSIHVYNYVSPTEYNTVFNPGYTKTPNPPAPAVTPDSSPAAHGTQVLVNPDNVDDPDYYPTAKDLKAIRWRLFIYPTFDGAPADQFPTTGPGELYGEGSCEHVGAANIKHLGNRKFRITVPINLASLPPIKTPIDPGTYRLRLELIYPRLKWIEYKSGPNATLPQYRSLVPDDHPTGCVTTVAGSDDSIAWSVPTSSYNPFPNGDSWFLRARDFEVATASLTSPLGAIVQTTGDPTTTVTITAGLTDNNPNAVFPPDSQAFGIWYQFPKYARHRTDLDSDIETAARTFGPGPKPTSRTFYQDDNYRLGASYSARIPFFDNFDAGKPFTNWVGSLEFALDAHLQDGYGATWPLDLDQTHHFCASAAANRFPMEIRTNRIGLTRFDNDPPSLYVTLISQADNRRWEIQLLEQQRDDVSNPTEDQLADSQLVVSSYHLDSGTLVGSKTIDVPGSAKGMATWEKISIDERPTPAGLEALLTPEIRDLLPTVRRSGRLQATFRFTDNVDYLDFTRASFEIKDKTGGNLITGTPPAIPLANVYLEGNDVPNSAHPGVNVPQARFAADMPMKVDANQGTPSVYQVKVECSATDAEGNTRSLVIPVRIVDSSFETRVLESRENRR